MFGNNLSGETILLLLTINQYSTVTWMSQTYISINALSDPWKKMLRSYSSTQTFVNTTNSSLWRLDDFKNKKIEKHEKSVKTLYTFLMCHKSAISHVEKAWSNDFGIIYSNTQWNHILSFRIHLPDTKLIQFRYKLLHKIIPNKILLHRWKLSDNPLCNVCHIQETYKHLFVECNPIMNVWKHFCNWLLTIGYKLQLKYIYKYLIVGYKIIYNEYKEFNEFLTIISYSIFRWYCISDNWTKNVNVLKIVLNDISERIQIYTSINLPCFFNDQNYYYCTK